MVDSGNIHLTTRTGYKHWLGRWEAKYADDPWEYIIGMLYWIVYWHQALLVGYLLIAKIVWVKYFSKYLIRSTRFFFFWFFFFGGGFIFFMHMLRYTKYLDGIKYMRYFWAATKQLYEWYFLSVRLFVGTSVCPSVCLSVCLSVTPFWLCSHHRIINHTFLTMFPSPYHHEIFRSYHQGPG